MDLIIYSYGHIDAMYYILNAIAMLMNHKFGEAVMATMAMGSVAYYAMKISYANTQAYKVSLSKVIGMIAMIYFLLIPRADMLVFDHISKKKEKIDNLPLGFALPVGMLEAFGDLLTGGFEQAFTMVGNTSYRDYGMVFGARLVQEARNWRIRSPEFMENMSNFIDRCVMIEAQIGHYYTPQDLLTSDDIWRLVSTNAGTLRQVPMRVSKDRTLKTCKQAATEVIEPAFRLEIASLEKKYSKTDIAEAGATNYVQRSFERLNSNFKQNIELAFKSYVGSNASAEQLIRQQMMMNSIKNYSDEYGYARASATQESNWMIAGDLAGTYLPILLSVLKGLVYSSFIFLFPLLMLSGGWGRYLGYLSLVASFQLWAPLNAVLNMFIDVYSSDTLSGIADHIVSFSTSSRIGNYTDKIVAVASGLQIVIPYLAFNIIQGGVGGFIHLAGTITGASQSAASQAANESVTNNKSFDNYSTGNQQLYNQSGFKTDWNQSYASGASSTQHSDGSMEKVTGGGNALFQSGVGFTASSGATAYRQEQSHQGQVTEGTQRQEAIHQQDMRSASNAKSNTFSKTADYIAHLAQREHAGESFNYDSMGEQGSSLQKAVNHTKQLHDNRGYGWEQAGQTSAEASLSVSTPFKSLTGVGASGGIKGSLTATNSSNQSIADNTSINRDNHTNDSYNNLVKAASNSSWAKENSIDSSYSDAVRGSYEEQQRLESAASISKQRVDDWHQAKSVVDSQGASSSRDMYQEVVDEIKKDYGVDGRTAQKWADQNSPQAQRVWQKLQNEDHYVKDLVNNIHVGKSGVSGDTATQKLDKFTNDNSHRVDQKPESTIQQYAINKDLPVESMKNDIGGKRETLQQRHADIGIENAIQYKSVKKHNEMEESRVQKRADKYEEDRIGQGAVAKGAAEVLDYVTGGRTGDRIGAPDKYSDMDSNNSTPIGNAGKTPAEQVEQQKASNNLIKDK